MGGPLARGILKTDGHIECPWHYWQFHHQTGIALDSSCAPSASCGGRLPAYNLKIEKNELFIDLESKTERTRPIFNHNVPYIKLFEEPVREPGNIKILGISTTAMDKNHKRYSTSEDLLKSALKKAQSEYDVDTKMISLSDLNFRNCEGFYSKSEKACSWPCSITKLDENDEMYLLYESLVYWADVVIVATPIRWGSASSLYYKMVERLNAIQNQILLHNRVLIKNKVASFIITGGQDNIQAVSGQMLSFFSELGFLSPAFPFVGHSLGWSAEDMEHNMEFVKKSNQLHEQTLALVQRSIELSKKLIN